MEDFFKFLNTEYNIGNDIIVSPMNIIILIIVLIVATAILTIIRKLATKNLPFDDKRKFKVVFGYAKWFVYAVIMMVTFQTLGVNVTGIFAASAALLIGIGLALQTFFQDIISGIFILTDKSVHVGDIIEIEGKIGKVEEIKLRTTRATTADNKVLIIPNHLYLTNSLYNWTQNGTTTRETVSVGVAYGSNVQLVKKILIQVATAHPDVLNKPEPVVLFTDFGESSLNFKVAFTINDSFNARFPQSDIRFEIDRLFRENNITIPFPQRDIHVIQKPDQNINLRMDKTDYQTNLGED